MEDNKYIYMHNNLIKVNKYGLKCNRSIPCVMYKQDDHWIVERKDLCDKRGSDCTIWLSSFVCVLIMPSRKTHITYKGELEWLN